MTWLRIGIALFAVLAIAQTATACPMCKEALNAGGGDLVNGFFYSILFMLSMPFLIVSGMSGYLYLLVRRARAAQTPGQAEPQDGPDQPGLTA
jgi:hypothetical protein